MGSQCPLVGELLKKQIWEHAHKISSTHPLSVYERWMHIWFFKKVFPLRILFYFNLPKFYKSAGHCTFLANNILSKVELGAKRHITIPIRILYVLSYVSKEETFAHPLNLSIKHSWVGGGDSCWSGTGSSPLCRHNQFAELSPNNTFKGD